MDADQLALIIVAASCLLIAIAHGRSSSRERGRLKGRIEALKVERDEAVQLAEKAGEAVEIAEKTARLAQEEAKREKEKAREQKHRADRQFHYIEDTIQERDGIWQIYRRAVLGAGNAQDLLFREIDRVYRWGRQVAQKHGFDPIEPSSEVKRALSQFQQMHRDEDAAKNGVAEAKEQLKKAVESRMGEPEVMD
jgi:hypothetical protein